MADVSDDYVCVVGNSHVRSFAACPAFLPLFMGPGREFSFTDAAIAQSITDRTAELLTVLGETRPVLFVLSEPEIRFALADADGRPDRVDTGFPDAVAARYRGFLAAIRERTGVAHAVLGPIPRTDTAYCAVASKVNSALSSACASVATPFVDLWRDCVDQDNGALRRDFDADGIHMSFSAAPVIARRLSEMNLLSSAALDQQDYRFAARHEFVLPSGNLVRVWGDLRLSDPSPAREATELLGGIAEALDPDLAPGQRIAVVGADDGYLAFNLARRGDFRIVAVEADATRRAMARRLSRVFARLAPVEVVGSLPATPFDVLLVLDGPMLGDAGNWLRSEATWPGAVVCPAGLWSALAGATAARGRSARDIAPGYILARRPG